MQRRRLAALATGATLALSLGAGPAFAEDALSTVTSTTSTVTGDVTQTIEDTDVQIGDENVSVEVDSSEDDLVEAEVTAGDETVDVGSATDPVEDVVEDTISGGADPNTTAPGEDAPLPGDDSTTGTDGKVSVPTGRSGETGSGNGTSGGTSGGGSADSGELGLGFDVDLSRIQPFVAGSSGLGAGLLAAPAGDDASLPLVSLQQPQVAAPAAVANPLSSPLLPSTPIGLRLFAAVLVAGAGVTWKLVRDQLETA